MANAEPDVVLDYDQQALLGALAHALAYLGRAESWVDARLVERAATAFNCVPDGVADLPTASAASRVQLLAPIPAEDYSALRARTIAAYGLDARRLRRPQASGVRWQRCRHG